MRLYQIPKSKEVMIISDVKQLVGFNELKEMKSLLIKELIEANNVEKTLKKYTRSNNKPTTNTTQTIPAARRNKLKSSISPDLKVLYTNADQLTISKKEELQRRIEVEKPMIVAVCEVKPKKYNEKSLEEYHIPHFDLHPVNLNNQTGRGIAIYTHESISKSVIQITSKTDFEEAGLLEIRLRGGDLLLFGCCYRSPTENAFSKTNKENLNKLLKFVSCKNYTHVCIVGDFNYRSINWISGNAPGNSTSDENVFLETIQDCFFHQQVRKPTRRRGDTTPTLIDLILTNEELQVGEVKHLPPLGKSDHDVLSFDFICYIDSNSKKEKFMYSKANFTDMKNELLASDWTASYTDLCKNSKTNPNDHWIFIKTKLLELRNKYVPKISNKGKSWKNIGSIPLDKETRNAIKEKEKAHRDWINSLRSGSAEESRLMYVKCRNKVNMLLRKSKRKLERDVALNAKKNPKGFWNHVRRKLKTKGGVSPLLKNVKDETSMRFEDKEKAEILSEQYSNVFTSENLENIPVIGKRTNKSIKDMLITESMVKKALMQLNPNKSPGPDQLCPSLLIELSDFLAKPLTTLFNLTLRTGILPTDWKNAFITPIFKKGSRNVAANYRPISLTVITCKILERFIRDKVVTHLYEENLLSNKQYGFISGRSTTTQLLNYLDFCIEEISHGYVVDSIYLDFSKAFDSVPHQRLLNKLTAYGIEGNIYKWIEGFLTGRRQEVCVNGVNSEATLVKSGIPQGTVLGPILFVIYINDLLDSLSSNGLMFADDTKIFRLITCKDDASALQADLSKLEQWSISWQIKFNPDKCHVLTLGKFSNIRYTNRYVVYGNEIDHVFVEKDLGVFIDSELTFEEHVIKKSAIANALVGQIRRGFSYLDCQTFRRIYIAFVRPHLEYGQSIWSPFSKKLIRKLENVQIRATKLVDGLSKLPYNERLQRIGIPTLVFRRKRGDLIQMFKHFNVYDRQTLPPSFRPRQRPSRVHNFQLDDHHRYDGARGIRNNFFYQRTRQTWNSLPPSIVNSKSVNEFKNKLDDLWKDMQFEEIPMEDDTSE